MESICSRNSSSSSNTCRGWKCSCRRRRNHWCFFGVLFWQNQSWKYLLDAPRPSKKHDSLWFLNQPKCHAAGPRWPTNNQSTMHQLVMCPVQSSAAARPQLQETFTPHPFTWTELQHLGSAWRSQVSPWPTRQEGYHYGTIGVSWY